MRLLIKSNAPQENIFQSKQLSKTKISPVRLLPKILIKQSIDCGIFPDLSVKADVKPISKKIRGTKKKIICLQESSLLYLKSMINR